MFKYKEFVLPTCCFDTIANIVYSATVNARKRKMVHDSGESKTGYIAKHWKNMSIFAVIGTIPALIAANNWYVAWHDTHNDGRYLTFQQADSLYPRKEEVIVLAEAESIKQNIATTTKIAEESAEKIDFLVKSEAVKTIVTIKQELSIHRSMDDGSILWKKELNDIETRLENAIVYRDCLFANSSTSNCDASKVW